MPEAGIHALEDPSWLTMAELPDLMEALEREAEEEEEA